MIIDMTAAGILAETVIPAYNPRYALAAVIKIPRRIPTTTTLTVNSSGDSDAGMYGSPCTDIAWLNISDC
jgi:tryptophan synthase beta subunit